MPIANKKLLENGDVRYLPINERIVRMVNKARKWAVLRRKKNADKKVAIIFTITHRVILILAVLSG